MDFIEWTSDARPVQTSFTHKATEPETGLELVVEEYGPAHFDVSVRGYLAGFRVIAVRTYSAARPATLAEAQEIAATMASSLAAAGVGPAERLAGEAVPA